MSNYDFDTLNNALSTQLERLMMADAEHIDYAIKRSNAVSSLAANINRNMSNAVSVAQLLAADGVDVSGLASTMPKMLGGGEL